MKRSLAAMAVVLAGFSAGQALAQARRVPEANQAQLNFLPLPFGLSGIGPGRITDSDLGGAAQSYREAEAQAVELRRRISEEAARGEIGPVTAARAMDLWNAAWDRLQQRRVDAVQASLSFVRISGWLKAGQL